MFFDWFPLCSRAFNDASAAYQNAIRWKVAGDTAHADAAVGILNDWVATCANITGDSNRALAAGTRNKWFNRSALLYVHIFYVLRRVRCTLIFNEANRYHVRNLATPETNVIRSYVFGVL